MNRTIVSLLQSAAEKYQDRAYTNTRFDQGWVPSSFKQTNIDSDYVAAFLLDHGVENQTKVGILSEGKGQWVTFEHGALKAQMVSVPLSIKLTAEEVAFRINHSESAMLAVSSNTLALVSAAYPHFNHPVMLIYLDAADERLAKQIEANGWVEWEHYATWPEILKKGEGLLQKKPKLVSDSIAKIEENDTINICYTSGTTGNPKGIMLTHLNYWANVQGAVELFDLPDATFETLIILPVDHSFAHTVGIYASMVRGITLHFVDSRGSNSAIIRNFPKNLAELNPSFLMTVP
ncbi:MAG: AMP-binding protein, partial [Sphaerochaeta sp.]